MSTPEAAETPAVLLVVEDNPANRYVLCSWLRRAGHTVIEAADGGQALALLDAADPADLPELAVIDVRLPDISGYEVCEHIKAAPATAAMPVIHVSATAIATGDRTQGLFRGADAYLTEPIAPSELLATVTAALRYGRARAQAERLAERLTTLNRATLEVYGAADSEGLAEAAVRGAAALFRSGAVVLTQVPQTDSVRLTYAAGGRAPVSCPVPGGLLPELTRIGLGSRTGVEISRVPGSLWRERLPDGPADLPLDGDTVLVAARTKRDRPAVCVALDAGAVQSDEDRMLLTQFAQACALALEALRSYSEEHTLALTLQRSFLPVRLPQLPGIEPAVRYVPASTQNRVGGDFYEALATADGFLVAVGDIVGHSLQAAVVMGELRHALRAYAVEGHDPRTVLERLDALLLQEWPGWTATVCVVLVAPYNASVTIANAGHLPPLLLGPPGEAAFAEEHGPLIGIGRPQPPATVREIADGTRVLLVTDGLIETRNSDITDRLQALRSAAMAAPEAPDALCEALLAAFGAEQDDDIVLLAARVNRR
ncbi:fused response regulator/phosphatase [Streptacidiphilus sp. PB12-B1b]|uniref:fused response regulator/phosphatase n=1 Tax=Streptacidiphilus sp. PB12-B1b TaxID=2705012 RepID=UPI0015FA0737|nr:fused response regulator/phosphatase [Streptacidiphilus sp. PB12-B1b]QMU77065.1 fused response regulator/phosphatase [Streptacidiphilus sp. PB12-B1b]